MDSSQLPPVNQTITDSSRQHHPSSRHPFSSLLFGPEAFYRNGNYLKSTKNDFSQKKPLPVSYSVKTERKIFRVVKQILSVVIFPIGLYKLIHSFIGRYILPASSATISKLPLNYGQQAREKFANNLTEDEEWKYKRFTIEVDGNKIDAAIMGKVSTFANGRWLLNSNGNCQFYEDILAGDDVREFKRILMTIDSNAIMFNYPGVGASSGVPSQDTMVKAYKAIMALLENKEDGIGAQEIIGYGHSIGAGVQGEFLKKARLKDDIKYVFVKSRTFSDLPAEIASVTSRLLGFVARIFGWNMGSVESSKRLQVPEIILQTARVPKTQEFADAAQIRHDDIIAPEASLAHALLKDKHGTAKKNGNKVFIGIREGHNQTLNHWTVSMLSDKIKSFLNTP